MRGPFVLLVCFVSLFLLVLPAQAKSEGVQQSSAKRVFIVSRVLTSAPPQEVQYFLRLQGESLPMRLEGGFVPARRVLIPSEARRDWYVGVSVSPRLAQQISSYAVLVLTEDGEHSLLPTQKFLYSEDYIGSKSIADFREEMKEWREQIAVFESEIEESTGELRRLRTDAEVIARAQRIIDVEVRIGDAEQEIRGITRDVESLQGFVQLARQAQAPRNFAKRERELTSTLKDLAEETKQVESEEYKRIARGEVELHNMRRVIEQTRFEDMEALRGELVRLRRLRQKLEGEAGSPQDIENAADYLQ